MDMQKSWTNDIKSSDPNIRKRAIIAMANSQDADALNILKSIYQTEQNPQLRELARKAGSHLWKSLNNSNGQQSVASPSQQTQNSTQKSSKLNTNSSPTSEKPSDSLQSLRDDFIQKTSPHPKPKTQTAAASNSVPVVVPSSSVSENDIATSNTHINRATAMLVRGDKAEAIHSLQQACKINPQLINNDIAQSLAAEITGQPGEQAIQSIMTLKSSVNRITKNKKQSGITLYLLMGTLVVLTIALIFFFQSGLGQTYRTVLLLSSLEKYEQNIGGYDVYIIPPKGKPPEGGWPVVVGLHGYACLPEQMLVYTKKFTRQGILYITPSFGSYEPMTGNGPSRPLVNILTEASNQYPINQDNVVLMGLSLGGEFAYNFSTLHPEWVKGVVTSGATSINIDRLPASKSMPISVSYNSVDGLQYLVIPYQVNPLIEQGYNVKVEIIDSEDYNIAPYDIEQAILFSKQQE
jgi:dienelactone hydrolase